MKQSIKIISTVFLVLSSAIPLGASAQPPVGRDLAANCFQCHGTDGRAEKGMPSIAGKDADSLFKKTREYQLKDKPNDIMARQAKGYTDAQISQIAEYFASVPEHLTTAATDEN